MSATDEWMEKLFERTVQKKRFTRFFFLLNFTNIMFLFWSLRISYCYKNINEKMLKTFKMRRKNVFFAINKINISLLIIHFTEFLNSFVSILSFYKINKLYAFEKYHCYFFHQSFITSYLFIDYRRLPNFK